LIRSRPQFLIILIFLIASILGIGWGGYNLASRELGGEGFIIQYISIRNLLSSGVSPYSDQTSELILKAIHYQTSFIHGTLPAYISPLYSGIVILPYSFFDQLISAHTLWMTAQLLAIFIMILVSLKITEWRPAWYIFTLFLVFTMFSYHVLVSWLDGGLPIWSALFLVLTFQAIQNKWNEVAGIFLALATIQPEMTILVILFTLIWGLSRKNKMLILWFLITIIALSLMVFFLDPDWIGQYFKIIYNFSENFTQSNPGRLFISLWPGLGKQLGWLFTYTLGLVLLIEWYLSLRKDFRWFLWVACLTITISQWIGLPAIPGNLIGLILPLILIAAMLSERWPTGGQWISVLLAFLLFIWEWILLFMDINSPQPWMQLNMLIPLPLTILIGLYWVRWWAIKPKRLLIEELRLSEGK
jgi:hypothetical protein